MAEKKIQTIYQALDAFYLGGQLVNRGDTVVAGHPMLKGRTKLFRKFTPTYTLEDDPETTSEPEPKPEEPA
jgi:hypothetical protein